MFSRRRRSASLSRPTTPASLSAQTAAAQAFLASQAANANLSNAAAAAALRASSTTPTAIGDIQTKRMLQRQSSVSSQGSTVGSGHGPTIQRRGSAGSMTERTFRSPSPNQPGSRGGTAAGFEPPVPPVPAKYNGNGRRERSSGSGPTGARMVSPASRGRGPSLDTSSPVSGTQRPQSVASALGYVAELERSGSRNSINFSRPLSPPAKGSPPSKPKKAKTAAPESPPKSSARNGISEAEISNVQQSISDAATAPVKKKKKKLATQAVQGSHLAAGGSGGRPMGTAVARPELREYDIESVKGQVPLTAEVQPPAPGRKRKKKAAAQLSLEPNRRTPDADSDPTETAVRDNRSQRASGALNKQPSVVREDWEGEQAARNHSDDLSPMGSPANQPQSRKEAYASNTTIPLVDAKAIPSTPALITTMPSPEIGTPQPQVKSLGPSTSDQDRPPSVSPNRSRSARFSANLASELTAEGRHEPPPRSVSPAKSALKHHSPSSQTRSPVTERGDQRMSSVTSSEASDTNSHTSADGISSSSRKKHHRVSFEMRPEIVGSATEGDHSELSMAGGEKRGVGLIRPTALGVIPSDDALEEVFKPRPALPSFGSIRGKRDGGNRHPAPTEPPSAPSSTSSSVSNMPTTLETSISSDHAIGALLARDSREKESARSHMLDPNEPLPPVVRSVEGSGWVSDTSSVSSTEIEPEIPRLNLAQPIASTEIQPTQPGPETSEPFGKPDATERAGELPEPPADVPQIAIEPATPGSEGGDRWLVSVPGGFPSDLDDVTFTEKRPLPEAATALTQDTERNVASSPADIRIAEPQPPEASETQDPTVPLVGSLSEAYRMRSLDQEESDSEGGSSIYSDAAEDLLEGDGFGSINAIVDSPVIPSPTQLPTAPTDSATASRAQSGNTEGWNHAQAHWSNLAQRQRDTVGLEKPKPNNKKASHSQPAPSATIASTATGGTAAGNSSHPTKEARSQTMRRSMRSAPEEAADGPAIGLRSSLRSSPQPAQSTPISSPTQAKGTLQKKHLPTAVTPIAMPPKPIQRALSNDSDSSSSFKRSRRPKSSNGRFSMRKSMRGSDEPSVPLLPPSSRGIRSVSPPLNRRPLSSGAAMRTSMRSSIEAPSLRGQQKFSGFGKSATKRKSSSTVEGVPPTIARRFKSKFANDSDDDDSLPRQFQSRFADSSDEEPEPLRPVRGIPRRTDEGDSTDLDDSSDDEKARSPHVQVSTNKALTQPSGVRRQPSNGSGRDLRKNIGQVPFSPKDKRKGIFGRFRSKRIKDDGKIGKHISESPARLDTHLERSKDELERTRSPPPSSPTGKLQRRHVPPRVFSDSWPLSSKGPEEEGRPSTSDGILVASPVNGTAWPEALRQDTSSTIRSAGSAPQIGRGGKKKRFPMLRRAFGLDD